MEFVNASYSKVDNGFTSLEYSGLILIFFVVNDEENPFDSAAVALDLTFY